MLPEARPQLRAAGVGLDESLIHPELVAVIAGGNPQVMDHQEIAAPIHVVAQPDAEEAIERVDVVAQRAVEHAPGSILGDVGADRLDGGVGGEQLRRPRREHPVLPLDAPEIDDQ